MAISLSIEIDTTSGSRHCEGCWHECVEDGDLICDIFGELEQEHKLTLRHKKCLAAEKRSSLELAPMAQQIIEV